MEFIEYLELDNLMNLIESIRDFFMSLVNLFYTTFSWLGSVTLTILTVGIVVALFLRFFGR